MSAAAGNPGLRYSISKPVGAKYRNSVDQRSTFSATSLISDVSMPSMSPRSNLPDRTDIKVGQSIRRDIRTTTKDEGVLAVKDVEYIDSFPVVGDDQSQKTDYVRKYLLDNKNTSRMKAVQLVIALPEIRIYDGIGEIPMMCHALKRIAFATCSPEYRHFSFVAREPRGSTDDQYCHAFLTRSAAEAEELNMLVASAFRMAYAQSQSPAGNRDLTPPSSQPIRAPSNVGHASNPPLTPIPISGSSALTFQDMLRGSPRDPVFSSNPGLSWSPAHSSSTSGPQIGGNDELSARLLQISTPNVDQMVLERRHRRNADQGGAMQLGGGASFDETITSHTFGTSSAVNSSPPSSRESKVVDSVVPNRTVNSSSDTFTNGCAIVRAALQPTGKSTASSSADINSAFDTMLMSNLLRTLKFGGGDARPHGSPVMILKELIDFHFVNRAFNEDQATLDRSFSPSPFSSGIQHSPVFTSPVNRSESAASKKCPQPANSRSRPLSGLFNVSNGDSQVNSSSSKTTNEKITVFENKSRSEAQQNGELRDDNLGKSCWYQPGLPRETVLEMLIQQDVGAFVVRDSTTHTGCYALSIRVPKYDNETGISHYLITKTPRGTVRLKGMAKEWNSLTALVTHHTVMRELLPCLLIMPRAMPLNGSERLDRINSEC